MPEKKTMARARAAKRRGDAPSTQAGEFVREEIHHVRDRKHGARSPKQAIAIGLSKARRAGVELAPPENGSKATKRRATRDVAKGRKRATSRPAPKRSRAVTGALKRETSTSASSASLSRQGKRAAARRSPTERSRAAKKAARTRRRSANA
jgi:hypothetical protein